MTSVIDFIHSTQFDDLPAGTVHEAVRCFIDTLGVAVGGSQTDLSRIIHNFAARQFGGAQATLWQDGRTLSPTGAALANASTIDALDAHDGHKLTKGHVGCGVLPGLIAIMQAEGHMDAREMLSGIVIGYEIGTRAGISLHASACDYHTSGAWVSLAVAALGARHLGLGTDQTRDALGIAEYHGPRSQMMRVIDHPVMVKDGSGWGAAAGVSAAYLAADGFTGAPAVTIEDPSLAAFWADLGSKWYVKEQYIKLYPVCRWAQPAVEGVLALTRKHDIAPDQVAKIHVETFHEATRLSAIPTNTEQAQYSLPFPVAAALVRGTVGVPEVTESGVNDPQINALSRRVEMSETEAFNAAFPAHRFAQVHVHMKDGRVLSSQVTEAQGDPENKLSDAILFEKFQQLSTPVMGAAWSTDFLAQARGLPDLDDAGALLAMMSAPKP